jgi:hypothetical protein
MIFTRHELTNRITATLPDEGIGQYYDCSITVCRNPLCQCNEIFVSLIPHIVEDGKQNDSRGARMLGVNIIERSFVEREYSSEELHFARKVNEWLQEDDYQLLWKMYYLCKLESTETADFDALVVDFPMEDIEQNSTMIGYRDVIPYARRIMLTIDGKRYFVEDLHCVKNNCQCTESILCYYPMDADSSPVEPVFSAYVDHKTKQWEGIADPLNQLVFEHTKAKNALEAKYPDIYELMTKRHRQLKQLYANYLKTQTPRETRTVKKPGSNDPCPCGSGKKYKKCCGPDKLLFT